ncbi:MAG: hypothetical protein ACOC44_12400 [Promethearchaeia archaeon]
MKLELNVKTEIYLDDKSSFLLSALENSPNYLENYPYLEPITYNEFEAQTELFNLSNFIFTFRNSYDKSHYEFIKPLIKNGRVYVPKKIAPLVIKNAYLYAALTPKNNCISALCFFKNYVLFTGCTDKDSINKMTSKYKELKSKYEKQRKKSLEELKRIKENLGG